MGAITAVFVYQSFLQFDKNVDEEKGIDGRNVENKEELKLELEAELEKQENEAPVFK